jgi:hypothetical protein
VVHIDISLLLVVSQEVMPDVNVLSAAVFNRIIHQANCTLIVTKEWDFSDGSQSPEGFVSLRAPRGG